MAPTTAPPVELKVGGQTPLHSDIKFTRDDAVWFSQESQVKKKKSCISTKKTLNICDCHINTAHRDERLIAMKATCGRFLAAAEISEGRRHDVPVTELSALRAPHPPSTLGCQGCARQESARTTAAVT